MALTQRRAILLVIGIISAGKYGGRQQTDSWQKQKPSLQRSEATRQQSTIANSYLYVNEAVTTVMISSCGWDWRTEHLYLYCCV
jgi:hypothetical protein